jgi:large repetitive protein
MMLGRRGFLRPAQAVSQAFVLVTAIVFVAGASVTPQAAGAISSGPNALPTLSIDDVAVDEGNAGTVSATFTITLKPSSLLPVTVNFATSDGTATAPDDYLAMSGGRTFLAGQTTKKVTVTVSGDQLDEASYDNFYVDLSDPANATLADPQGRGRIVDDDPLPTVAIGNVSVLEGNAGTVGAAFTISLSAPSGRQVTVDYTTADGTAQAPGDYGAIPATTLTFAAGQIARTVAVQVKGDVFVEPNETLAVNLSSPGNATIADSQGLGTILNDDVVGPPPPPDQAPRITVPANVTAEAQSFAGAPVTYSASAVDRLGRPLSVGCNPPSGSMFSLGETTVTCSATDSEVNATAAKGFKISVLDRTPPAVHVPSRKAARTTSRSGALVAYAASAIDLVDGPVTPTCTPLPHRRFRLGLTKVTCFAADRHGNVGSASFTVAVTLVRRAVLFAPLTGARVTKPPLLAWRIVPRARFYNVQLYRKGIKVLTTWPTRSQLQLHSRWIHQGRRYELRPAAYTWVVWPAFGTRAHPRYGRMLGRSTFRVVAGPR